MIKPKLVRGLACGFDDCDFYDNGVPLDKDGYVVGILAGYISKGIAVIISPQIADISEDGFNPEYWQTVYSDTLEEIDNYQGNLF